MLLQNGETSGINKTKKLTKRRNKENEEINNKIIPGTNVQKI